jgi:hypothetical protein
MKIFWSWQSDTHQATGRYFVRDLLVELARELNGVDGTEEADRPDDAEDDPDSSRIEVDHDTLGVAGHPPIADTILAKIRSAGVFVADMTPIAVTKGGKKVPNPNVMIELGYALRELRHERIILVMNQADDAKLSALPFDLRHWRAPVPFKLKSDATPERIAEEATKLKADLKPRLEASLKVAAREINQVRRTTNREPELSVEFASNMEQPVEVTQQTKARGVKTLAEIKAESPLLSLDGRRSTSAKPDGPSATSDIAKIFAVQPPERWSREEADAYNRAVESYYVRYERYLEEARDYSRLVLRSFKVSLALANEGTAPATNIDADVFFPKGIVLHDFQTFPGAPEVPAPPPLKTVNPGEGWLANVRTQPARLINPVHFRTTHVLPEAHMVRFDHRELKHHDRVAFDEFVVSFATAEDIGDFDVDYVITAREPIDPIRGKLRFSVVLADGDVEPASA